MAKRTWTKTENSRRVVVPFELKATDQKERTFEGDLSTSHLDLGDFFARDIVHPGAFNRWIDHFKAAQNPYVPLLDSHDRFSVMSVFGHLLDAEERLTGEPLRYELEGGETLTIEEMSLWTKWQVIDGDDGQRLMDRMEPGSVRNMSMGYEALQFDFNTLAGGDRLRNLREVRVEEGSLVVFGMQPNAQVDLATVQKILAEGTFCIDDPKNLAELQKLRVSIDRLLADGAPDSDDPPEGGEKDEGAAPAVVGPEVLEPLLERIQGLKLHRLGTRIDAARHSGSKFTTPPN